MNDIVKELYWSKLNGDEVRLLILAMANTHVNELKKEDPNDYLFNKFGEFIQI